MLNKGLIVSCQAVLGEPLYGLKMMHHFARAAVLGGAKGIRANYVDDINDIKNEVDVPVIGIIKAVYEGSDVYITPTVKEARELLDNTQCEVIALDCTGRKRPNGEELFDIVTFIRNHKRKVEIMADCATLENAAQAYELGFDYVGSTMRGYTDDTKGVVLPDIAFLSTLVKKYGSEKIIAEGGIWEVEQLERVLSVGIERVVIGSSITRPMDITKRFNKVFEG